MAGVKKYAYCWTINNYTIADDQNISALEDDPRVRYFVYGREVGAAGVPHYQGYIYFHSRIAFNSVKKLLPRAHIESQRATIEQAIDYCKKDGDFTEFGDKPFTQAEKGKRGREYWEEQLDLCKRGRIEECDPKLQITHHTALYAIKARNCPMPPDNADLNNHWYYGETGTGKSRKARTENPGAYLKMCNKWWDGYNDQEVVVIEDFDKVHKVLGHHMKIWSDRYAFPAEIKGSKVNLRPRVIIVTSNYSPSDIWGDDPSTLGPILRRFAITHFIKELNSIA